MSTDTALGRALAPAETAPRPEEELQAMPFPAVLVNASGAISSASSGWLCQYPAAAPGTRLMEWWAEHHPTGAEAAAELEQILARGKGTASREYTAGDECRRVLFAAYPSGALVTEHRLAPADPRSQKMEAIGRLAGGVAHDFANLLTLIAGYSEILLSRIGAKDPTRPEMEEIRAAAERGARLTGQLLTFLRGDAAQPQSLDLNAILRDMQSMLRPIIGEHVEMHAELATGLDRVLADPGQVEQILLNLILNARDAMPEGGRITLQTRNCEMNEALAQAHGTLPGRYVMLSIADTGHGIPAESIGRIFEPFFTTKRKDKGTGLGLSTVYGIVKRAGGDVWAASLPGHGAVFTLCLPGMPGVEPGDGGPAPRAAGGCETVLLVEDEEGVRSVLAKVLRRQGYQVLEAADGLEALRLFECRAHDIGLVVTDLVMPRMGGHELSQRLRSLRPELKIVFMSGYPEAAQIDAGQAPAQDSGPAGGVDFLQKPLRPNVFAAKVREALDSPA